MDLVPGGVKCIPRTKHDKTQVADAAEAVTELDHKYSKFMKEFDVRLQRSWEFGGVRGCRSRSRYSNPRFGHELPEIDTGGTMQFLND